jgi:hypothetical protein
LEASILEAWLKELEAEVKEYLYTSLKVAPRSIIAGKDVRAPSRTTRSHYIKDATGTSCEGLQPSNLASECCV